MKKTFLLLSTFLLSIYASSQNFEVELFAQGLNSPVEITHAGDERLFVVEQGGRIKILQPDGTVLPQPFLDISNLISTGGERGLLGLAFDPNYNSNGRFFVNYTNTSGNTVIARYIVDGFNPNVANPNGTVLLTINQPFSNHNGGTIKFGPDGYLWISLGDGGSGGDPNNYGQNTSTLLGKMLRIDVSGDGYVSPADNPFVGGVGEDEIWSYGLRNAWKFSFDRETHEVWIADVGQNQIEEVNRMDYTASGLNYGWRCYEGNNPYNTSGCAPAETMTFPIATYNHSSGRCSLTGGYVYRGTKYPNLVGTYFFGDFCSREIGTINGNELQFHFVVPNTSITTFGEDVDGELYVAGSGKIYKIIGEEMASTSEMASVSYQIHPNPVSSVLNVTSKKPIDVIRIYSVEGKLIKTFQSNLSQIDVSDLIKGMYILQIEIEQKIYTEKLIKL